MKRPLNLVGPQVRRLRNQKGWSQEILAQRLQLQGWDLSRTSVAKLEAQLRWVSDCELIFLSKALGVTLLELYPRNLNLKKIGLHFRG